MTCGWNRAHPRTYNILERHPGALDEVVAVEKIEALLDVGVRGFVDLTEDRELLPYAQLLPARGRAPRGVVYLHCRGGCGRTSVVIGCYLIEHGELPEKVAGESP
jgi:hypothetical protein